MSNMNRFLKYTSLLMAAVMFLSCEGTLDDGSTPGENTGDVPGVFVIQADKSLIQSNGEDYVTFTVMLDDADVTAQSDFYDAKGKPLTVKNGKFAVTEPGEYQVWANYETYNSEKVTIRAIPIPVPETPADPKPESTDFKPRVLLVQFTATGCSYCPSMMDLLHPVLENEAYADDVVWAAIHSSGLAASDPGYITGAAVDKYTDYFRGVYPSLNFDMSNTMYYYQQSSSSKQISDQITACLGEKDGAVAGIAVNSSFADNTVIAKVSVKSGQNREYRVGAFLLEDGLEATQTGATKDWMNTHNSVIRYIDASLPNPFGYSMGAIAEGKTSDYIFIWDLNQIWESMKLYWDPWVESNLRMVVFVTTVGADGYPKLNNVIQCPIAGQTPYEYL